MPGWRKKEQRMLRKVRLKSSHLSSSLIDPKSRMIHITSTVQSSEIKKGVYPKGTDVPLNQGHLVTLSNKMGT